MQKVEHGLSDNIRTIAQERFVEPALRTGKVRFSISVRDLMDAAEAKGIPTRDRVPAFCTSIQKKAFLAQNHLRVLSVEGPESGKSTTVVIHYQVEPTGSAMPENNQGDQETAESKALRLTERLRGLFREEIVSRGGTEAFIRWVRSAEAGE